MAPLKKARRLSRRTAAVEFHSFLTGRLRFYHTHVHAGGDLNAGQHTGQVGPLYIEPKKPREL